MANYRKNRMNYRSPKGGRQYSGTNIWLWLLTGMFVGILGAAIIYMLLVGKSTASKYKNEVHTATSSSGNRTTQTHNSAKAEAIANLNTQKKDSSHQFEFYNILPSMEVNTNHAPSATHKKEKAVSTVSKTALSTPPASKPSKGATPAANKLPVSIPKPAIHVPTQSLTKLSSAAEYLVQIGLFRKLSQADELKANLALQGFFPTIQKLEAKDGAWFRVSIGPYSSQSLAQKEKIRLEKQKIHGVLVLQGK